MSSGKESTPGVVELQGGHDGIVGEDSGVATTYGGAEDSVVAGQAREEVGEAAVVEARTLWSGNEGALVVVTDEVGIQW